MHHIGLFYLITDYAIEQKTLYDVQEVQAIKWYNINEEHTTHELTPFATYVMKYLRVTIN